MMGLVKPEEVRHEMIFHWECPVNGCNREISNFSSIEYVIIRAEEHLTNKHPDYAKNIKQVRENEL